VQDQRFIENAKNDKFVSDYMRWIGHTEFGPHYIPVYNKDLTFDDCMDINHWVEQWVLTYQSCHEQFKDTQNVHFVCYEQICSSRSYWSDVLDLLKIQTKYDFKFIESQKEIESDIDYRISGEGQSLYSELLQCSFRN
jgi:hypothetical protein